MADANRLAAALRYQQDMEGPVTMNPNIAEQGRKGKANMAPPTSVMDPRSRDYERRSRETENFLIGADILAGALPFAPLAKGAAMAAGRYATPKVMQGMENYMGRTGMTLNAAPQDEALRLAQQRAALPVEQHGLGLPADNTPAQRADVMFPESGFHATGADITKVDPVYGGKNDYGTIGQGFYVDPSKDAGYSNLIAEILSDGGVQRIMPLRYDASKLYDATDLLAIRSAESSKKATENIKNAGYSGTFSRNSQTQLPNEVAIFDPDVIRSRFAAFDPWRRNSALAAALGVAAPDLLAEEK